MEKRETSVFFSYAHKDKMLRDQLENHLSILKYRGLITTWHDREITAGDDWERVVNMHLESASIILLLISASFMASHYCYSIEMERALERHRRGEARVIPVLLRPVLYTDAPFASLQMLPSDGRSVVTYRVRDKAFMDVAKGIERVLQQHGEEQSPLNVKSPSIARGMPPFSQKEIQLPNPTMPPPTQLARRQKWQPVALIAATLLILISIGSLFVFQHFALTHVVATPTLVPTETPGVTPTPTSPPYPAQSINTIIIISLVVSGIALTILFIVLATRILLRRRAKRRLEGIQRHGQEQTYYQQALIAYEQALKHNPSDREALKGKGIALEALEHYNEALDVFRQFVALAPDSSTYTRMGDMFMKMNQAQGAVVVYEQATKYDEQNAQAFHGMGQALERLGKINESERAFEKAKQLGYED